MLDELIKRMTLDYEDEGRAYLDASRAREYDIAGESLCRMKLLAKNLSYAQQIRDGTLGKHTSVTKV